MFVFGSKILRDLVNKQDLCGDTGNAHKQVSETKGGEKCGNHWHAFLKEIDHSFIFLGGEFCGLCSKDCAHCKDLEKHHGLYGLLGADLPIYNTLIHWALYVRLLFLLEMDHFKAHNFIGSSLIDAYMHFWHAILVKNGLIRDYLRIGSSFIYAYEKLQLFIGSHYGWYIMSNSFIQNCNFSLEATMVHMSWIRKCTLKLPNMG